MIVENDMKETEPQAGTHSCINVIRLDEVQVCTKSTYSATTTAIIDIVMKIQR
jgi:hypothetical protein